MCLTTHVFGFAECLMLFRLAPMVSIQRRCKCLHSALARVTGCQHLHQQGFSSLSGQDSLGRYHGSHMCLLTICLLMQGVTFTCINFANVPETSSTEDVDKVSSATLPPVSTLAFYKKNSVDVLQQLIGLINQHRSTSSKTSVPST